MEIVSLLKDTPNANRAFAAYYDEERKSKRINMSLQEFLMNLHFKLQLGVWIDFLTTYGIGIDASMIGYVLYALNDDDSWDKFGFKADDTGVYVIDKCKFSEPQPMLYGYAQAILEAMKYLNEPASYLANKPLF